MNTNPQPFLVLVAYREEIAPGVDTVQFREEILLTASREARVGLEENPNAMWSVVLDGDDGQVLRRYVRVDDQVVQRQ